MDIRIRQKSLAEHIVEDLESRIIGGVLKPGQRIIEEGDAEAAGRVRGNSIHGQIKQFSEVFKNGEES